MPRMTSLVRLLSRVLLLVLCASVLLPAVAGSGQAWALPVTQAAPLAGMDGDDLPPCHHQSVAIGEQHKHSHHASSPETAPSPANGLEHQCCLGHQVSVMPELRAEPLGVAWRVLPASALPAYARNFSSYIPLGLERPPRAMTA